MIARRIAKKMQQRWHAVTVDSRGGCLNEGRSSSEDAKLRDIDAKLFRLDSLERARDRVMARKWKREREREGEKEWKKERERDRSSRSGSIRCSSKRSQSWSRSARFFGDSSADGNYEVTLMTKATVYYSGLVVWQPPAVYKSSCSIDVEFFPYDVQTCVLKLGSWTYDGFKVPRQQQRARSPDWTFLLVIYDRSSQFPPWLHFRFLCSIRECHLDTRNRFCDALVLDVIRHIYIYIIYIYYIYIYISILLLGVDCSVIWLTFVVMSYGQLVFIYYSAVCSNDPTGSHIWTRSLKTARVVVLARIPVIVTNSHASISLIHLQWLANIFVHLPAHSFLYIIRVTWNLLKFR